MTSSSLLYRDISPEEILICLSIPNRYTSIKGTRTKPEDEEKKRVLRTIYGSHHQ